MAGFYFFGPTPNNWQKLVSCGPVELSLVSEQKDNQYQSLLKWVPNNWT